MHYVLARSLSSVIMYIVSGSERNEKERESNIMNASTVSIIASTIASVNNSTTLSEDDADTLLSAIGKMHTVVRNMGEGLPSWDKCSTKDRELVVVRALRMLEEKAKAERVVRHNALRAKLSGVFATYMDAARKEKAEFDAISPTLKVKLGITFPDTVKVPVSEVAYIFGEGLTLEQVIHNLDNMSFKIGKTDGRKEKNTVHYIILPFTAG